MKAAVLKDTRNMVIEDVPTPEAGPGEVVVKVKYVGICGSDLHLYTHGLLPPDTIMGHEASGVISELGEGVEGWSVGEHVAIYGGVSCLECFWCRNGNANICPNVTGIGLGFMPGAYAEYVRLDSRMLLKLPENVDLETAALTDPYTTAIRGILLSGFQIRETALVIGAGPIGLCAIQELKLAGAGLVVATEFVERRAKQAKEWGADVVLSPDDDLLNKLAELTNDIGIDYVFECVGIAATTQEAFNLVRKGGKVVLVGVCMEAVEVHPLMWMLKEISMQTSMGFDHQQFKDTLGMFNRGALRTDGFVTEKVSIEQLPDAFERLLTPNDEIKVLLEFPD